jgi:hypothetical protein
MNTPSTARHGSPIGSLASCYIETEALPNLFRPRIVLYVADLAAHPDAGEEPVGVRIDDGDGRAQLVRDENPAVPRIVGDPVREHAARHSRDLAQRRRIKYGNRAAAGRKPDRAEGLDREGRSPLPGTLA